MAIYSPPLLILLPQWGVNSETFKACTFDCIGWPVICLGNDEKSCTCAYANCIIIFHLIKWFLITPP